VTDGQVDRRNCDDKIRAIALHGIARKKTDLVEKKPRRGNRGCMVQFGQQQLLTEGLGVEFGRRLTSGTSLSRRRLNVSYDSVFSSLSLHPSGSDASRIRCCIQATVYTCLLVWRLKNYYIRN